MGKKRIQVMREVTGKEKISYAADSINCFGRAFGFADQL